MGTMAAYVALLLLFSLGNFYAAEAGEALGISCNNNPDKALANEASGKASAPNATDALVAATLPPDIKLEPSQTPLLKSPRIIKVSMMTGRGSLAGSSVSKEHEALQFQRALKLHEEHAHLHGHGHFVQRSQTIEGSIVPPIYTKIATLLSLVIGEMQKPPELRAEWLL